MKKILSLLLTAIIVISSVCLFSVPASALETDGESSPMTVPQIRITTENGNGTTLQKADGYVNASIIITDTDGSQLSDSVQFKVRGNSTALESITKKAYTFKFESKQNVLGMGKAKKWALLANAFDPTLMRNYLAFELARTMGLAYTSEQRFVELWVDDSFRGCYLLIEPIQEGKARVDIDIESNNGMKDFLIERENSRRESGVTYFLTDGIRFAVSEPEEPTSAQLAYIRSTMNEIMTVVQSGDRDAISQKIDIPSFVRYYLLNELYKTVDFDFSSVFFYYKDGVLYAGPAWDYDLAAGNLDPSISAKSLASSQTEGLFASSCHLYQYLASFYWFIEEIQTTYREYLDDITALYAEGGMMDDLLVEYGAVFARNFKEAGWKITKKWVNLQKRPESTFDANVAFLRGWLKERNEWLSDYYGVTPEPEPVTEPVTEPESELLQYILGDADGDGMITVYDATAIQRLLVDLHTDDDEGIALRGRITDKTLNISDATVIQRYLVDLDDGYPIGELRTVGA